MKLMKKLLLFFSFVLLVFLFLSLKKTAFAQYDCTPPNCPATCASDAQCPCGKCCPPGPVSICYSCDTHPCPPANTPTPTPRIILQPSDTPIPGATNTPAPCPYEKCGCGIVQATDEVTGEHIWGCWCQRGCWQWACDDHSNCTSAESNTCSNWAPGCPTEACKTCQGGGGSTPTDVPSAPVAPDLSCDTAYGATCSCTSDTTPRWLWTLETTPNATNFMLYPASAIDGLPGDQLCSVTAGCSSGALSGQFVPSALTAGSYQLQVAGRNSSIEGLKSNPVDAVIDTGVPGAVGNFIANSSCVAGSPSINFSWTPQAEEASDCLTTVYQLQISVNSDYSSPVVNEESLALPSYTFNDPQNGTTYYARVRAVEKEGTSIVHDVTLNWVILSASGVTASCPWYKLKNTSLHKSLLNVSIPTSPDRFDEEDTNEGYLDIGQAGIISSDNPITLTSLSAAGWKIDSYSRNNILLPEYFLEYVRSRKEYSTITELTADNIATNKIYFIQSTDLPLNSGNLPFFEGKNVVLIVQGNVDINEDFELVSGALAVIATDTIKIKSSATSLTGIFIGNSVDFAYDIASGSTTGNPLKIDGNIIAINGGQSELKRSRSDNPNKPSIFVVLDPLKYVNLLPYLSTANYEWKQVQ